MTDSDKILDTLRQMVNDESLTPSQRLRAIEELNRRAPPEPPHAQPPTDPDAVMRAVVEKWVPQIAELADAPADPMRDLDWDKAFQGNCRYHSPDPIFLSWVPTLMTFTAAELLKFEAEVVTTARRLGVGMGPFALPGAPAEDELEPRRRKRGA